MRLLNWGMGLSNIDVDGGVTFGYRDGSELLVAAPIAERREEAAAFTGELLEAAESLRKENHYPPLALSPRHRERIYERVHYLSDFQVLREDVPAGIVRSRLLTTREIRLLDEENEVPHGRHRLLLEISSGERPRSLFVACGLRGFDREIIQSQTVALEGRVDPGDDSAELIVSSRNLDFWARWLGAEGPEVAGIARIGRHDFSLALLLSARLYFSEDGLLRSGFEIRGRQVTYHLHFEEEDEPVILEGGKKRVSASGVRLARKGFSIESLRKVVGPQGEAPAASVEGDDSGLRVQCRGGYPPSPPPVVVARLAGESIAFVEGELRSFDASSPELQQALLERILSGGGRH